MMRYLHQQSVPIFRKLAVTMFNGGAGTPSSLRNGSQLPLAWVTPSLFLLPILGTFSYPRCAPTLWPMAVWH